MYFAVSQLFILGRNMSYLRFKYDVHFTDGLHVNLTRLTGADPGGGPCPPPPFSGEKTRGPKTTHTEKKRSKSDNQEARYRLKRTPKHTKYAQIKKILVRWGGGGGPKGPQGEIFCS